MGSRTRAQHRRERTEPNRQVTQEPTLVQSQPRMRRLASKAGRILCRSVGLALWLLGNMSVLLGFLAFYSSQLVVTSQTAVAPASPFDTLFTISNSGYLPIVDVTYDCTVISTEYEGNSYARDTFRSTAKTVRVMHPNEGITIPCLNALSTAMKIVASDMYVGVTYRAYIVPNVVVWPRERKRSFRFETVTDTQGNIHWVQQPCDGGCRGLGESR